MVSVKVLMKFIDKNRFVLKILEQTESFTNQTSPENCHIQFDDESIMITNCKVSSKNYLFIIEGTAEIGQEVKPF